MTRSFLLFIYLASALVSTLWSAQTEESAARERTLSIDLPDREIAVAIREVADLFEINVVVPETLRGRTSIKMSDVTWRQAFQVILTPLGYRFVEDGNVVKVVRNQSAERDDARAFAGFDVAPWYLILGLSVFAITTALCHVVLFIGVLQDRTASAQFAPRWVWAFLVLLGGVFTLTGYWIIHHSSLRTASKNT
jgi:hypothetical protein